MVDVIGSDGELMVKTDIKPDIKQNGHQTVSVIAEYIGPISKPDYVPCGL
jgi:hypothetical protein